MSLVTRSRAYARLLRTVGAIHAAKVEILAAAAARLSNESAVHADSELRPERANRARRSDLGRPSGPCPHRSITLEGQLSFRPLAGEMADDAIGLINANVTQENQRIATDESTVTSNEFFRRWLLVWGFFDLRQLPVERGADSRQR